MSLKIAGLDQVLANLNAKINDIRRDAFDAQTEEGERILSLSQQNVPIESGELHDSGTVTTEKSGDTTTTTIEFDADHAIYVHEIPRGEGYKFLDKSLTDESGQVVENIARKIKV